MIAVLGVLMLPAVATITPLFIFLNQFRIELGDLSFNLRNSLVGVSLAVISGLLPFAIWNLKGYLDTIPRDLEEAAAVDGATQNQIFRKVVLPLADAGHRRDRVPGLPRRLDGVPDGRAVRQRGPATGRCRWRSTAWSGSSRGPRTGPQFAAFAILFALPVSIVFFFFQRYLVGGLAVGGVKG